ncbi:MAG: single-stranded DNA-binding protein [Clostridia bacterium]|nr:single-stranded DNA-binding protein [Clostridia bacterium]
MNLNKAMVIGNLTRDPELKTTSSGQNIASFSVATNMTWTDSSGQQQKKVEFHNIVAWRKLADICGQYLRKGSKVYIEGRLQTNDWLGQDGSKRYRTDIILENLIMLDKANTNTGPGNTFTPNQAIPQKPEEDLPTINADEEEISVKDIPF